MKAAFFALALFAAGVMADSGLRGSSVTGPASIMDCGSKDVTFTNLTITPNPPVKGQPVALNATGTVSTAVSSGSFSFGAFLDGGQVFEHNGNICGASSFSLPLNLGTVHFYGLSCPAKQGDAANVDMAVTFPTIAPPGNYEIKLTASDGSGTANAVCIDAKFSL